MSVLAGGVFAADTQDEFTELRSLVDDIGSRAADARIGQRRLPESFDELAWRNLDETGLSRLTSDPELGAGPAEAAVVLRGLARRRRWPRPICWRGGWRAPRISTFRGPVR